MKFYISFFLLLLSVGAHAQTTNSNTFCNGVPAIYAYNNQAYICANGSPSLIGGSSTGTVTSVSVTTANGVSGTVATATTTPAISLTLGAIVPTSVNGITLTTGGSATTFLNGAGAYTTPSGGGGGTTTCATTSGTNFLEGNGTAGACLDSGVAVSNAALLNGASQVFSGTGGIAATNGVVGGVSGSSGNVSIHNQSGFPAVDGQGTLLIRSTGGSNSILLQPATNTSAELYPSGGTYFGTSGFADPGANNVTVQGNVKAPDYISVGTKFTTSGCSVSSTTGGATAGKFTVGANTCTVVVTLNGATGVTAPNGWACTANDETSTTVFAIQQTASNATTASFSIPATAGATDVINFGCTGY